MAKPPARGLDRVGQRWKAHLDAQTSARWRLRIATPRSYWARRFTLVASQTTSYEEMEAAFTAADGDPILDRMMADRDMTIWAVVYDPVEEKELLLTIAAFGDWQTAMTDMAVKIEEWAMRYPSDDPEGDAPGGVNRLIIFVGKR